MANMDIEKVEGIGPAFSEKLRGAGVKSTDGLLTDGGTKAGRAKIAKETGISETQILKWVNMADLFRIKGVGAEFAELLEAAGVDTVKELATRKPENLAAKMAEVNATKKLTRVVPSEAVVTGWVTEAKGLPAKVSH